MKVNPHRSSLGMDANVMALLCYIAAFVLSWIPIIQWIAPAAPLVVFFIEKGSPFVKFHAMQAFLLEAVNWVFFVIINVLLRGLLYNPFSYAGWGAAAAVGIIYTLIGIALTVFAIIALVKAYGYFEFKIPVIGNLADKWSKKGMSL